MFPKDTLHLLLLSGHTMERTQRRLPNDNVPQDSTAVAEADSGDDLSAGVVACPVHIERHRCQSVRPATNAPKVGTQPGNKRRRLRLLQSVLQLLRGFAEIR